MLPDTAMKTAEARIIPNAALVVAGLMSLEQGAYIAGLEPTALLAAMNDKAVADAVEAEVTRLKLSGDLSNLKAATLTDRMLDKLLATSDEDISTTLAIKVAELGLRFKEKAAPEVKADKPKAEILIWHEGEPEPASINDDRYRVIIRLKNPKPARVIDHEDVTNAE